jgi:hypothetical protein
VDEILRLIRERVSEEANIIFGATTEEAMKGGIRVSLILTGPFESELSEHPAFSQSSPTSSTASAPRNYQAKEHAPSESIPIPKFQVESKPVSVHPHERVVRNTQKPREHVKSEQSERPAEKPAPAKEDSRDSEQKKASWWDRGSWF